MPAEELIGGHSTVKEEYYTPPHNGTKCPCRPAKRRGCPLEERVLQASRTCPAWAEQDPGDQTGDILMLCSEPEEGGGILMHQVEWNSPAPAPSSPEVAMPPTRPDARTSNWPGPIKQWTENGLHWQQTKKPQSSGWGYDHLGVHLGCKGDTLPMQQTATFAYGVVFEKNNLGIPLQKMFHLLIWNPKSKWQGGMTYHSFAAPRRWGAAAHPQRQAAIHPFSVNRERRTVRTRTLCIGLFQKILRNLTYIDPHPFFTFYGTLKVPWKVILKVHFRVRGTLKVPPNSNSESTFQSESTLKVPPFRVWKYQKSTFTGLSSNFCKNYSTCRTRVKYVFLWSV